MNTRFIPRLLGTSLGVAALIFAASFSYAAENEISNPGFESGVMGWEIIIPPDSKGKVPNELKISSDNPHEGQSCSETSATEFARYVVGSKKSINVTPGERYHVRAWVRFDSDSAIKSGMPLAYARATIMQGPKENTTDPRGHIHIGLNGLMARTANVQKLAPREEGSGWRKIEGVFEIPPDTSLMFLHLIIHGVNGKVFWDDILVEKVSSDTPLSPEAGAQ